MITYLFGFYDFRKIALAGEMPDFQRYLARVLEEIRRRLREESPKNVTQAISIFDLHGFNARQHLCLQCTNEMKSYEHEASPLSHALLIDANKLQV